MGLCQEADPPVNRMTDVCKNITLPQTSFAGGKGGYHFAETQHIKTVPKVFGQGHQFGKYPKGIIFSRMFVT